MKIPLPIAFAVTLILVAVVWAAFRFYSRTGFTNTHKSFEAEDSGDPLVDADRRMAYGLFEEATSVVKHAIQLEPSRKDLKAKLFEVLFVSGNVEQFQQAGRDFGHALRKTPEWAAIRTMASQICPDDRTFN
jgi:Tfp pilus assembly protein FimV